jgi:glycosyltransferase involved in cell wall biosynthesis
MTMLSVVIPAYNEQSGIREIAERVLNVRPSLVDVGVDQLELLIVDDGSTDDTAKIAKSIDGVQLIVHQKNQGYGAALKTGFRKSTGELIGFLDADGTYPPEYFADLCKVALDGAELVVGSRFAGSSSEMPVTRKIGNRFFAALLTIVGRQNVSDSASGMRVFRREILERIYPLPDGLNLTPVMSTRAVHEGVNIAEVPIPYSERVGQSKLSIVRDGSVFLHSIIWTALTYNPVRILGIIGLGGILVALAFAAALVIARLTGVTSLGPWGVAAVYFAMVSGVIGVSVFLLGVTFNYLISLFYKRPVRQGLFGNPIFKTPLDRQFWWMGLGSLAAGLLLGLISLILGLSGWEIARLWLYLLASAMFILMGIQLVIYWILLRVLDEISQRDFKIAADIMDDVDFPEGVNAE